LHSKNFIIARLVGNLNFSERSLNNFIGILNLLNLEQIR